MTNLVQVFTQLNLKEEHLKIYLANLSWGETSITNLARKSEIPRTSIYSQIRDLLDIGLISQSPRKDGKYYVPADPEFISQLLARKQLELQQSIFELNTKMNQLKAVQNTKSGKPKIEFLEGPEGIKQAYERTFEAKEIWIQCLSKGYEDVVPGNYFAKYFEKFFLKTNIKSKEILPEENDEYIEKYSSSKNLQLRIKSPVSTETDFWVYDDKVTFISFNKDNPYALVVEDKQIANSMRLLYGQAWKQAAQEDARVKGGKKVKTEF